MTYEKFARLFCEIDWLSLPQGSRDHLAGQVEAIEVPQVLPDQEDLLVSKVFLKIVDKVEFQSMYTFR